ncbi:MAG: hypothetical protein IJL38_05450 [Bacteroidales bacterium]|nr:hypothetical protein [Bacteroidales bacterium]
MKTTSISTKMKSLFKSLALTVVCCVGLMNTNVSIGQNISEIDEFPEGASQTITQKWGNRQVVYDQKSSTESYFIVVEPHSTNIYPKITLDGIIVRDFVVFHDSVFFTGDNYYGDGFYAYFSLNAVMSGIVDITYRYLTNSDGFHFYGMDCIKAFTLAGETNVMLIGNRVKNEYVERCLFNTQINSSSLKYIYDANEHFDDVEILDDYVVSAARKGGDIKLDPVFLRFYPRVPTFNMTGGICDELYTNSKLFLAFGRVRLQKYNGSNCGLLFKNKNFKCNIFSFEVNNYPSSNIFSATSLDTIVANMTIDTLLDVGFNQLDNRLFILMDSIGGFKRNLVANFSGHHAILNSNASIYLVPFTAQSVADFEPAGFYVSSVKNGILATCWQTIYYPTNCINSYIIQIDNLNPHIEHFDQTHTQVYCSVTTETTRYFTQQNRYDRACRVSRKEY